MNPYYVKCCDMLLTFRIHIQLTFLVFLNTTSVRYLVSIGVNGDLSSLTIGSPRTDVNTRCTQGLRLTGQHSLQSSLTQPVRYYLNRLLV